MDRTIEAAVTVALICLLAACSSKTVDKQQSGPAQPIAGKQPGTPQHTDMTGTPTRDPGAMTGGTDAGTPMKPADDAGKQSPRSDAGRADAQVSTAELPLDFTNVDVTRNTKRRFGAPHVAVNPKNPDNIVVLASSNLGYTRDCVPAPVGSDCEMIAAGSMPFLTQPRGFYKTPGFMDIGVFVSFDRGKTFKQIDVADMLPPGHPEVRSRGEGPIAALADGTFYIGFNAINWGSWEMDPVTFFPNGGVGVIKSTDGGMTWTWVSYSHTPADWPYGGADRVTGTFYVTSGLGGLSTLGPRSTGLADSPDGTIADRWISSTKDGVTWTDPQPLGGDDATGNHVSGNHSSVAAAHGIVATMFLATDQASCSTFLGATAPSTCVVFQTSTDEGATWSRHLVPTPAGFTPDALNVLLGADPTTKGLFTVVLLNETGSEFWAYRTTDSGDTWSEPVKVAEDATKIHFAPFVAYSPKGEFGLMWRTYETEGAKAGASPPYMPYSVWAAISNDGGATFSQPLKVSKANSPAPPDDPNDAFSFVGDHGPSGLALDEDGSAYVVWADWTPGERAIFFSAINVKSFNN